LGVLLAVLTLGIAPGVASADFSVAPTPNGLTITTYTGSLNEFAADGNALDLVSAFATVDGEFVGYVFGAPDFVNNEFTTEFAGGLDNEGVIVRAGAAPPTTGDADVDAVINAVRGGNAATVGGLVELQTLACTTAQGAGGPPKCEGGDPNGTEYDVLPLVTCEGEWVHEDDVEARLAMILDDTNGLYAVVESDTDELPAEWPASGHYVIFHLSGGDDAGVRFHVSDGAIVLVWLGCVETVDELTEDSDGSPLPFVIGPFESD
jgi:hypothetical protein